MMCTAEAQTAAPHPFTVYAFMPWNKTNSPIHDDIFAYKVRPIRIIYHDKIFTEGEVDLKKIQQIAVETAKEPEIPVSFDLEFGKRFHPETVLPKAITILQAYNEANPNARVGVYAMVPQVTYAWKESIYTYDKLTERYKPLTEHLDFLSPSLYNHDGKNFEAWAKTVRYNMETAKRYAQGKPIIPYISPIYRIDDFKHVKNGNLVEELSEEEMKQRLQLLYDLGASGCIIWVSSQDRNRFGQIPFFSADRNWGKAVVDFIKDHS